MTGAKAVFAIDLELPVQNLALQLVKLITSKYFLYFQSFGGFFRQDNSTVGRGRLDPSGLPSVSSGPLIL